MRGRTGRLLATQDLTPRLVALLAALGVLLLGLVAGSRAAGGADSAGYLAQARSWTEGRLQLTEPATAWAGWPIADWTFSPLGYRPGTSRGTLVPLYPPGYPLTMAAVQAITRAPGSVFLVVPFLGALAVYLTFLLGCRLDAATTGMWAALLLACNPVFLFQVVQPMSDVPATAWWLVVALLVVRATTKGAVRAEAYERPGSRRIPRGSSPISLSFLAGAAASVATLTRPNLAPLAVIPAVWISLGIRRAGTPAATDLPVISWRRLSAFCLGAAPGALALAWINGHLYGSPFRSGYGDLGLFFSLRHVGLNLARYPAWLWETHGLGVFLGIAAAPLALLLRRRLPRLLPVFAGYALVFSGGLYLTYVLFTPFDNWTYLRYLLPAFPPLLVLGTWLASYAAQQTPRDAVSRSASVLRNPTRLVLTLGLACLVADSAWVARRFGVLDVQYGERRYPEVARYVSRELGNRPIIIALQHTGSLRYYAGTTTIRYDLLDHEWLDRAVSRIRGVGRRPVFVLEEWEERVFRQRFKDQAYGALDWPASVQFDGSVVVRLYDPADRDLYRQGLSVPTTHVRVK